MNLSGRYNQAREALRKANLAYQAAKNAQESDRRILRQQCSNKEDQVKVCSQELADLKDQRTREKNAEKTEKLIADTAGLYTLSVDDLTFLKNLRKRDRFIEILVGGYIGLKPLYDVLSKTASGPVKLVLQWDAAALKGYQTANGNLIRMGRIAICEDIKLRTLENSFYEKLWDARQC